MSEIFSKYFKVFHIRFFFVAIGKMKPLFDIGIFKSGKKNENNLLVNIAP